MNSDFSSLGLSIPEIFLPRPEVDLGKWAVVACDQYTSQPGYWDEVARLVGSAPSTYHLIYPEAFLGQADGAERIRQIHQNMRAYLEKQILVAQERGFIYLERHTSTSGAHARQGLVAALDLECYDYRVGAQTFTRATEGTVLERIPPRVRIREGAPLESPHIMVLIDDPDFRVLEPLSQAKAKYPKLYETQLMMNGGKVRGYLINQPDDLARIYRELALLADPTNFATKYGIPAAPVLLFAVGDGNHSLATAKSVWERMKEQNGHNPAIMNHPARYALVELVNIHDPALQFEPIHRVLFDADFEEMIAAMRRYFGADHLGLTRLPAAADLVKHMNEAQHQEGNSQWIGYTCGLENGILQIANPRFNLAVGSLQAFLDQYLKTHPQTTLDYIHGEQVVAELSRKPGNIGFYLPVMTKQALFKTVIVDGVLPRKTFSMGEAEEKRFYLECRKIS